MSTLKRTQMYFSEYILRELKRKALEEKTTVTGIDKLTARYRSGQLIGAVECCAL